jgi:hypothetical protein
MKLLKYILLCPVVCIVLGCFILALFFGVAGISAITQITFSELIVLFSLCYLFSFAGSRFLAIADQLYTSIMR